MLWASFYWFRNGISYTINLAACGGTFSTGLTRLTRFSYFLYILNILSILSKKWDFLYYQVIKLEVILLCKLYLGNNLLNNKYSLFYLKVKGLKSRLLTDLIRLPVRRDNPIFLNRNYRSGIES